MAPPERKKIKNPHALLTELVVQNKKTVSYRNISREFQIHVNDAKRMMQDFYDKEKSGPNAVYAVFMLSGTKKVDVKKEKQLRHVDDITSDMIMPSSPPASQPDQSWMFPKREEVVIERRTVTMCRDEHLEAVKETFDSIDCIQIHTLGPQRIRDWIQVAETGRMLFRDYHSMQDPLVYNKIYGTIQNPKVTRRTAKRPANIPMPAPKPQKEVKAEPKAVVPTKAVAETKSAASSRPTSAQGSRTQPKPSLKKEGSSLFKAFAKQSAAPKKVDSGNNSDAQMSGMDDNDEGEDDDSMFLDADPAKKKRAAEVQKEKDERKFKLQKMMDDDDDEPAVPKVSDATEMDIDPPAAKVGEDADAPDGDIDWSASDSEKKKADQEPKRRRGKRKVMKKKTVKDDEGFLVTREEEVWESFSEDEPAPKPAVKPAAKPAVPVKAPQKGPAKGAAAGAAGKKNIMSYGLFLLISIFVPVAGIIFLPIRFACGRVGSVLMS